jgi:hypothetical protein
MHKIIAKAGADKVIAEDTARIIPLMYFFMMADASNRMGFPEEVKPRPVNMGGQFLLGDLRVKPLSIEMRRAKVAAKGNGKKDNLHVESVLVLKILLENTSMKATLRPGVGMHFIGTDAFFDKRLYAAEKCPDFWGPQDWGRITSLRPGEKMLVYLHWPKTEIAENEPLLWSVPVFLAAKGSGRTIAVHLPKGTFKRKPVNGVLRSMAPRVERMSK